MNTKLKKSIGCIVCGILFEIIIFMWYKEFSCYNYASIPPAYVSTEVTRYDITAENGYDITAENEDDITVKTFEIPIEAGNYILELSYECTAETEWQLVNASDEILCQGILDPGETKLQESFEIGSNIPDKVENENPETSSSTIDNEADESIKFIITYAKEGELSIGSFGLNRGTENILTLQGKDFNSSYIGFQDGEITKYYAYVGRQEFYGLRPYQQITIQNNTSDVLYFDVNDCMNYENPQRIITEKKLEPGESWQYHSTDTISYQVFLYSAVAQLEDISVTVDNKEYMNAYKKAVVVMMGIVAFIAALGILFVLSGVFETCKKYWEINAVVLHILGIILFIFNIEPYIVNIFLLVSVFMIVAALLLMKYGKNVEYPQEYNHIYAGILTILLGIGMYILILNAKEGSFLTYLGPIHGRGLLLYILVVVTTILVFIGSSYISAGHNGLFQKINPYLNNKEVLLLGIMLGNLVFKDHIGVELLLDWRRWQLFLVLAMLVAITVCLYKAENNNIRQKELALKALYLFEIIGVQINKTLINIYGADSQVYGETHHISAYYDEITNIAAGRPFGGGGSELYGHYAVLWRIPMMIFGNNLKVIGIVAGIVAAVTFFFFILTIHKIFHSRFIKIMASLALWCVFISDGTGGFSSVPHRYVFLSVVLYFMVRWQMKRFSFRRRLTGHLLCIMALFWNTESGLCVSMAWAIYIVVREIEKQDNCFWLAVRKVLIQAAIVGVEIILFFGSVEFYNRFLCISENQVETSASVSGNPVHEEMDVTETDVTNFVHKNTGVLFDSGYMGTNMNERYHFENQPAFTVMSFILLVSLYLLSGLGLFGKSNQKEYAASVLAVCVFGLMFFAYSATRGFSNINKCGIPFLIVFFFLFEKVLFYLRMHSGEYTLKNNIVCILGFFMLVGLVQMELYCFVALNNFDVLLNEKKILDYDSMQRDMEQFAYYVPEDTYAYGNGIAEVYMSIDREIPETSNTQYIVTDAWRDMSEQPYVKVRDIPIGKYIYTLYYNQEYVK